MQFAELKVYFYFLKSIKKMNTLVLGTSYRHYEFSDHSSLNRDSKPKALMQLCLSSVRVELWRTGASWSQLSSSRAQVEQKRSMVR